MTIVLGWVCSAILVLTILAQVVRQHREETSKGVSPWLFIGQFTASSGLGVYSVLRDEWVFVVLNFAMASMAVAGMVLWVRYHRKSPSRSD